MLVQKLVATALRFVTLGSLSPDIDAHHEFPSKLLSVANQISSETTHFDTTWIIFGNLFLAWKTGSMGHLNDHFPTDDLESLDISTNTLFSLMEILNQPIPCGLLLGTVSRAQLELFCDWLLATTTIHQSSSCSIFWATALLAVVTTPTKAAFIINRFSSSSITPFSGDDIMCTFASALLDGIQSQLIPLDTIRHLSHVIEHKSDSLSGLVSGVTADSSHLLMRIWQWIACCKLDEHPLFAYAWSCMVEVEALPSLGGLDAWLSFLQRHLAPQLPSSDRLDSIPAFSILIQKLCLQHLPLPTQRDQLRLLLKQIFLANTTADFVVRMLDWRMKCDVPLLQEVMIESAGLVSAFNRITDAHDESLIREIQWLSFLDPQTVLARFAREILSNNVGIATLGHLFRCTFGSNPSGVLRNLLETALVELLHESISASTAEKFVELLGSLKSLHSLYNHGSSASPVSPLFVALRLAIPTLQQLLYPTISNSSSHTTQAIRHQSCPSASMRPPKRPSQVSSSRSTRIAALTSDSSLPAHTRVVKRCLSLILCEVQATYGEGTGASSFPVLDPQLLQCAVVCDSYFDADSELGNWPHRNLTDTLVRELERVCASHPSCRPVAFNLQPVDSLTWTTLVRAKTIIWGSSVPQLEKLIPGQVWSFITNRSFPDGGGMVPKLSIDILFASSSCSSLSSLVAASLESRNSKVPSLQRALIRRHLAMASACVLPLLSDVGFELCMEGVMLPLASWPESVCGWEEEVARASSIAEAPRNWLRTTDMMCRLLDVLARDFNWKSLECSGNLEREDAGAVGPWHLLGCFLGWLHRRWQLSDFEQHPTMAPIPLLLLSYVLVSALWRPLVERNPKRCVKGEPKVARNGVVFLELFFIRLCACLKATSEVDSWNGVDALHIRAAIINIIKSTRVEASGGGDDPECAPLLRVL